MDRNRYKKGQNDKEYYDELIKQRIGEALRNEAMKANHERLDLETLERWVREDKERRRLKNRIKRLLNRFRHIYKGEK